jgi:hypothetical protein
MGTANSTGYYDIGEVEDYKVFVEGFPLSVNMSLFEAELINNSSVRLTWAATEDVNFMGYDVERSRNGTEWERLDLIPAIHSPEMSQYEYIDYAPYTGNSFYRLKLYGMSGAGRYSAVRMIKMAEFSSYLVVFPNPATDKAMLSISGEINEGLVSIEITDANGTRLSHQEIRAVPGNNTFTELPVKAAWPSGIYYVRVFTNNRIFSKKLVLQKK